jgi:ribosome-binding protein aMBF1 (putative translation factor)
MARERLNAVVNGNGMPRDPIRAALEGPVYGMASMAMQIRELRRRSGLTAREFAVLLNTTEEVVERWQACSAEPSAAQARDLVELARNLR